jgi:hypothetical protein
MRWLSGGGLILTGGTILLLTGWDIFQSFGPAYEPTTIFAPAKMGHAPVQPLWALYAAVAAVLVWVGILVLRTARKV